MKKNFFIALGLFILVGIGSWAARSFGFYNTYWFTDVILHLCAGGGFGFLWLALNNQIEKRFWMVVLSAASFAVLGSVAWELWEFAGWHIMPSHTQFYVPEMGDSLGDVWCGFGGGVLAALTTLRRR